MQWLSIIWSYLLWPHLFFNLSTMNWYIKLHRKILDNPIAWSVNLLSLFIYILLRVNYESKTLYINNQKVDISPWEWVFSQKSLAIFFKCSIWSINRRLSVLFSEWIIESSWYSKFTLIKVINRHEYQSVWNQIENKMKAEWKQNETNKNNKKYKNIESIDSKESISSTPYGVITPTALVDSDLSWLSVASPQPPSIRDDINQIIWLIKSTCIEYGIVYNPVDERNFWKHILSKKFSEVAHGFWMDTGEFVKNIILLSVKDSFRWWKIDWPKSIYQKYPHVLNNAKNKFQSSKRADLSLL